MSILTFDEFLRVKMCVGTILEAKLNPKARNPAYVLKIDFGTELGTKLSSAQITTAHPDPNDLVGTQVAAVMNFEPKRVAGIKSEVLVIAAVAEGGKNILLAPQQVVKNGTFIA